jgi:hypothetical protein
MYIYVGTGGVEPAIIGSQSFDRRRALNNAEFAMKLCRLRAEETWNLVSPGAPGNNRPTFHQNNLPPSRRISSACARDEFERSQNLPPYTMNDNVAVHWSPVRTLPHPSVI